MSIDRKPWMIGDLLAYRYQIKAKIGTGGFAELYLGEDILDGKEVAIKAQMPGMISGNSFKTESDVLEKVNGRFAPKLYHYCAGEEGGRRVLPYIVMELLRGEDMSEMRHRQPTTSSSTAPRLPLPIAAHLSIEMVRLVKELHALGYIHRDMKPNNFMRKSRKDKSFWLIDFGIAKLIIDEATGEVMSEPEKGEFRGTTMFASVRAHQDKPQSKKDDMISLLFVFVDLLLGRAPWAEEAKSKNKKAVQEMKEKFVKQPQLIIREDRVYGQRADRDKIAGIIAELMQHLDGLGYQETPNYSTMIARLEQLKEMGTEEETESFDWQGIGTAPGGYQRAKLEEKILEVASMFNKQVAAMVHMSKDEKILSGGKPPGDAARIWAKICDRVLTSKDQSYEATKRLDHLERLLAAARRLDTFFLAQDLSEDEFMQLQLGTMHKAEKTQVKARKRLKKSHEEMRGL